MNNDNLQRKQTKISAADKQKRSSKVNNSSDSTYHECGWWKNGDLDVLFRISAIVLIVFYLFKFLI